MVLFNYSTRELTAKIVYYGPGLCGKTTNLQYIFDNLPGSVKGKMLSLATKTDRTLFFDFLPLDLGEIRGMKTRIQLYTVPGQVFYNETRRLVLKGADGVVFVADSQKQMAEANLDSYKNLEENLRVHSMRLAEMPLVVQYNKRDLPGVAPIAELNSALNLYGSPYYESVATTGIGVQDTLKAITKLVLLHLTKKYDTRRQAGAESARSTVQVPAQVAATGTSGAGLSAPAARSAIAAAPGFDDAIEGEEEILELTEVEDDQSVTALEDEEPIALEEEFDQPAPMAAAPAARGAMLEQELEIDESEDGEPAPFAHPSSAHPAARHAEPSLRGRPSKGNGDGAVHAPPVPAAGVDFTLKEGAMAAGAEVPRLVPGQEREIAVPVEIELNGTVRQFTLSIRVRLSESPRGR